MSTRGIGICALQGGGYPLSVALLGLEGFVGTRVERKADDDMLIGSKSKTTLGLCLYGFPGLMLSLPLLVVFPLQAAVLSSYPILILVFPLLALTVITCFAVGTRRRMAEKILCARTPRASGAHSFLQADKSH